MLTPHHRREMSTSMFDLVNGHLRKLAVRVLNDRHKRGEPWARKAELAEALAEYVRAECRGVIYWHDYGEPRASARLRHYFLDGDRAVEAVALSAATYVLARWTPAYIRERQERGRRGGSLSKRSPTWTDADLDKLATLDEQTVPQQAVTLGRSASTVDRMRRALKARSVLDLSRDHLP